MIINDNPLNTASDKDKDQGQDGGQVDRGRGSTKGVQGGAGGANNLWARHSHWLHLPCIDG